MKLKNLLFIAATSFHINIRLQERFSGYQPGNQVLESVSSTSWHPGLLPVLS